MKLMSFLRSLIGETDTAAPQASFQTKADSYGVNFFLPQPLFNEIKSGTAGSALQKIQMIALKMLMEQGLAEPTANGFRISAEDIAGMDAEQAEPLQLPPRYEGSFETQISGRTGNSGFRVKLSAKMPNENAFIPIQRKGPYLYLTSEECYRLTPGELMGLQALEAHETLAAEQRGEPANLRLMAELQTASRSGMRVDLSHFERLDVVIPENIGVTATRLPDGSLLLCPSLGDGSTPDQLAKRWPQLEMSADGGVVRIDNRVVLLDKSKMDGIRNVLENKRIPADKVSEFMQTPTAFLDATLVNLDVGFSVRVEGIGKLKHMDFGSADTAQNDWFAIDQRPSPPEIIPSLVQSFEDLNQLTETFKAATEQGASSLCFADTTIEISDTENVQQQLVLAESALSKPLADTEQHTENSATELTKETVTVLLKEAESINQSLLTKANTSTLKAATDWNDYARQPFPHQREGIEWMLRLINAAQQEDADDLYRLQGGLLADDMGLGKTYMSLVAVGEYLKAQQHAEKTLKPILVVAPLSLLENWEDEVDKTFTNIPFRDVVVLQSGRDLKQFRVLGAERESVQLADFSDSGRLRDEQSIRYALTVGPEAGPKRLDMDRRLVLTTYHTLRDYQFSLCRVDWGMVIFDEAQNIKNPNALQTRAAKGLKADFKLLATGTPVENSLGDFWCLMDTAQPGLLGNWERFRDTWIKPVLSASEAERDQLRNTLGKNLRDTAGTFMLRRVKEDQLQGLPTKTIRSGVTQPEHSPQEFAKELGNCMRGLQLKAYDDVLDDYHKRQAAADDMRGAALTALSQLRSVSLHPRLSNEGALYSNNGQQARLFMQESGKLAATLALLDQIQAKGEKVILFMVTKSLQRLLKLWLDQIYKLDIAIINGDTKAVATKAEDMTRKKLITEFEAKVGFNALIMSPVAAGVGLTVIGANHVIHLERHWNPAKEAQASDRVYRIGQKKDVFIHLPIVTHPQYDSFDVHLDRLLRAKLVLKDAVVTPEQVSESDIAQSLGL